MLSSPFYGYEFVKIILPIFLLLFVTLLTNLSVYVLLYKGFGFENF